MKSKQERKRRNRSNHKSRYLRHKYSVKRQTELFQAIDGNLTYYPVGYCKKYKAWLTPSLADIHNCFGKKCPIFEKLEDLDVD